MTQEVEEPLGDEAAVETPEQEQGVLASGGPDRAADGPQHMAEQKIPWWRGVFEFVAAFAIMVAAIMAIRTFVIEPFEIPSGSMLETIQIGDRVFAEKVTVAIDPMPEPGEIVTFVNPRDESEILIKRVVAVEGQTIDFVDGVVHIDGVPLDEPYVNGQKTRAMRCDGVVQKTDVKYPYTIPEGCFWAMGDNRGNSADSRVFGAVSAENVTGRAVLRYWPILYVSEDESTQIDLGFTSFSIPSFELAIGPLD